MSEPITIAAILSTAAVIIAIVRSIQGNNKEQRTEGKTEAQQLAALQLAQVQAAAQAQQAIAQATSQWQLSLFQSEAKLAKQMDQIANEVGQIAKSVASFTKETEERFRSDDRDFNRIVEKIAKHGAQLDSLLVQESHNTGSHPCWSAGVSDAIQPPRPSHASGESSPHLPAMRPIPRNP